MTELCINADVTSHLEVFNSDPTASELKNKITGGLASQQFDDSQRAADLHNRKFPTLEELQVLVREDSILPDDVRPSDGMPLMDVSEVGTVFLTGATGNLGPYLLRDLSQRPNIKKIYCLVRKRKQASPMERLLNRLDFFHLQNQVDLAKVECIQGDITEDKFGLSEEDYNRLAKDVDAIVNSAARVSYLAQYYKATEKKGKPDIRTANVISTIGILEFAVHTKLKHFYHASTLLAIMTTNDAGCAKEDWQDVGAFDEIPFHLGYPFSKHISEQLCRQAVERGIPCKVFRHPLLGGDSQTGRCDFLSNHFVLRWLTYLKLNCMPDSPIPIMYMPVDVCSKISLDIFFNPQTPHDIYNISQREIGTDQSIIGVANEFGIEVEPIPFTEFVDKSILMGDSPLSPFHTIYVKGGQMAAVHAEYEKHTLKFYKEYFENRTIFYGSHKLSQFVQNYDELESTVTVMKRDMHFLKDSGIFDKLGIKY